MGLRSRDFSQFNSFLAICKGKQSAFGYLFAAFALSLRGVQQGIAYFVADLINLRGDEKTS